MTSMGTSRVDDIELPQQPRSLSLRAGDVVEVKSLEEIMATLDDQGCLDGLPFMPEMLKFCGRRLRVFKSAHKTCDTIDKTGGRTMRNAVHLEDVRCDGAAHGGCQAACLIFWKESWLRKVEPNAAAPTAGPGGGGALPSKLAQGVYQPGSSGTETDPRYRCQTTELKKATSPLAWWDIRQYARDAASGNVSLGEMARVFVFAAFRKLVQLGVGYRVLIGLYDGFQRLRGGRPYPVRTGTLQKTPKAGLDLAPGEWVRVKSHQEILATLDTNNKNNGLSFDVEMVRFCGGIYRVESRVTRIIEEKNGRMLQIKNPCIILTHVYCRAELSERRLFCPRAIFPYWREIWLERVAPPAGQLNA